MFGNRRLIDYFAIGLTHGLIALAAWRLLSRADLDDDAADPHAPRRKSWRRGKPAEPEADASDA
ncbi:hypothetical protein SZ64_14680 [Erythrobacter sp. SG61-1L]|nr:hypothetical protein SZ64_14680 [Erythrobacter sp. SG61-1L]